MSESLIGLGRLHLPDARDLKFPLRAPKPPASRRSMYWISQGQALDQGATPQCVAYAGARWLTSYPVLNKQPDIPALYRDCQKVDEWPGEDYDGTSVRALFKVLKARGLVSEYRWGFDAQPVLDHLLTVGPVVVGTDWHMDMFMPDAWGYIAPGGENVGGHAYLLIGVNLDKKNPDRTIGAVRLLNSWGDGWGQNGRAWMTIPDFRRLMGNYGEACAATEVKSR